MKAETEFKYFPDTRTSTWLQYQRYFLIGMQSLGTVSFKQVSKVYNFVPGVDYRLSLLIKQNSKNRPVRDVPVGQYTVDVAGQTYKVAIDAADSSSVHDPALLDWCDLYFKCNYWPDLNLPAKVRPYIFGNGSLMKRHLTKLQSLRGKPRERDFVFISKVYAERDVELFKALGKLKSNSKIIAIHDDQRGREKFGAELDRVGIEQIIGAYDRDELWQLMSTSRLTLMRAGRHLCVPWRMTDALCMGACVVMDSDLKPQWYKPLIPGSHYISAQIRGDNFNGESADYAKIVPVLTDILSRPEKQDQVREVSARYFDDYASPVKAAKYIVDSLIALKRS